MVAYPVRAAEQALAVVLQRKASLVVVEDTAIYALCPRPALINEPASDSGVKGQRHVFSRIDMAGPALIFFDSQSWITRFNKCVTSNVGNGSCSALFATLAHKCCYPLGPTCAPILRSQPLSTRSGGLLPRGIIPNTLAMD